MFSSVFLKTLYEKRWTLIGWSVAVIGFTLLLVLTFPMVKTLGDSLKTMPESMKSLFGDISAFQVLSGYFDLKVISSIIFLTIILAIIMFSELIAGKEDKGTLQSLLAQPVKRSRVYLEMLLAASVILAAVSLTFFVSTAIGAVIVREHLNWLYLFYATLSLWLVSLMFGTFGFAIGAITGKRGLSGTITGILAFAFYIITLLAPTVKFLKYPNYVSPLKFYNTPSVIQHGLHLSNVGIMVGASLIFVAFGFLVFVKRDVYQK